MPFHMIGATEAAPGTGTVNIAFPLDDRYARLDANDSIKITPDMQYLLGVMYAAESTGGRAIIRQPGEIDKSFTKCSDTAFTNPILGFTNLMRSPIKLKENAKLQALSVNATDEDTIIGLMVGTGYLDPKPMQVDEVICGYSDTTITALAWTTCAMTWEQDLKAGKYSVVGMTGNVYLAANPWTSLLRLSIPGNPAWKPGVPASIAAADHERDEVTTATPWAYWGDIGVTFNAPEQMPNIEALSPSAITDENVQLMLKRV